MRNPDLLLTTLTAYQRMKLTEKDSAGYRDWTEEALDDLVEWLRKEVHELELALIDKDREEVWREAADVANIAAMIAQRVSK